MVDESLPRSEYPRPQFVRQPWVNLNGRWTYAFDFGKSGWERGFAESIGFDNHIVVPIISAAVSSPFCCEFYRTQNRMIAINEGILMF